MLRGADRMYAARIGNNHLSGNAAYGRVDRAGGAAAVDAAAIVTV